MTDPIPEELTKSLHASTLGEGVACDYHQRPKELATDESVLCEAIWLIDHPQLRLDQWPNHWAIDAARCADHAVDEIVAPTRGFEETLITIPLTESNSVVSVSTPEVDDVRVFDYSPATRGTHPMLIDQQFTDASEPNDHERCCMPIPVTVSGFQLVPRCTLIWDANGVGIGRVGVRLTVSQWSSERFEGCLCAASDVDRS